MDRLTSVVFASILCLISTALPGSPRPRPAVLGKCAPNALVALRSAFREYQKQVPYSVNLMKAQPALRQLELFKYDNYKETNTCGCPDEGPAYSAVDNALQNDTRANRVCNPKVSCSYDQDRYPPVIYHVKCNFTTEASDPFICNSKKNVITVLRRSKCQDANDTDSEQWDWVDNEILYTGCELKSKCSCNQPQEIQNIMKNN